MGSFTRVFYTGDVGLLSDPVTFLRTPCSPDVKHSLPSCTQFIPGWKWVLNKSLYVWPVMYILLPAHLSWKRGLLKVYVCESQCVAYTSSAAGMCAPRHTPTGDVRPCVGTWTRACALGGLQRARCLCLVWGTRDWGGLAEGDCQNYSQAPNTAVEISHDLPNSTFYIL